MSDVVMSHDLEFCVHCRRPVALRFNGVGLYFHWVENNYFVDVVQFIEGCKPLVLFREILGFWMRRERRRLEQRFMT